MTHPDIPIFYGYNAPSRRGNASPFARVRPQRWGKKDAFHRIPFLVNRANVKTAIVTLGTGDLLCYVICPSAPPDHPEYGAHLKFFKTYHRLSENFFWQNMYTDTKIFVRSCTIYLSRKNAFKIPPAPHQPVEQSKDPGETCHMDIFGPLKTTPKADFVGDVEPPDNQQPQHCLIKDAGIYRHHGRPADFFGGVDKRPWNSFLALTDEPQTSLAVWTKDHMELFSSIDYNSFVCAVNLKESDGRSPVPKVTIAVFTFALFTRNGIRWNASFLLHL
ncbi:integrase catalytic domain-containing protein [Trichonephila clavipes]|nr:integrase catalytic domain-containing protein [Trichonephila clavipes]